MVGLVDEGRFNRTTAASSVDQQSLCFFLSNGLLVYEELVGSWLRVSDSILRSSCSRFELHVDGSGLPEFRSLQLCCS